MAHDARICLTALQFGAVLDSDDDYAPVNARPSLSGV